MSANGLVSPQKCPLFKVKGPGTNHRVTSQDHKLPGPSNPFQSRTIVPIVWPQIAAMVSPKQSGRLLYNLRE